MEGKDRRALTVAFLKMKGFQQGQIADALGIAESTVARALSDARKRGFIRDQLSWPPELSPAERQEIEDTAYERRRELQDRLSALGRSRGGVPVQTLGIIYVDTSLNTYGQIAQFGHRAAPPIKQLITPRSRCAVAWGRTVAQVSESILGIGERYPDAIFVPIAGDPLNYMGDGNSPSTIAETLRRAFGARTRLSLHGIPARIPFEMDEAEVAALFKYIKLSSSYRKIFDGEEGSPPLLDEVDVFLSGLGDATTSQADPWYREVVERAGIESLSDVAIGNIGGIWFPNDEGNPQHRDEVDRLNGLWLGVRKEQLVRCARRADDFARQPVANDASTSRSGVAAPRPAGVILVAVERQKVRIVERAVGMVNHLFITPDLADALLDALPD